MRAGPSAKFVVMIERPVGAVNAAARPLTKRVRISSGPVLTRPPASEASAKTASAIRKTLRRPSRSAVRPPSEQQAAVAEDVAADQPLQGGRGEVELGADRGQCDADHRDVEAVEEQDDAEGDQQRPGPRGLQMEELVAEGVEW